MSGLDPEDAKIVALARATRARAGAREGAAVRDPDGRTYTAATVELASLRISALRLAVAMAISSGVQALDAAAVVSDGSTGELGEGDRAAVRELGGDGVYVLFAAPDGTLRAIVQA